MYSPSSTSDISELGLKVATEVYSCYKEEIASKGLFSLVLSGGNTPKYIFECINKHYSSLIDWSKVHVFWLDERCVSPNDLSSNFGLARDHLLTYVNPATINRMKGEIAPELASAEYEVIILKFFSDFPESNSRFDFILLGMGEDGHIASIFPNCPESSYTRFVFATEKKHVGHRRISLTLAVINNAKKRVLLVTNIAKKKMLMGERIYPVHKLTKINTQTFNIE